MGKTFHKAARREFDDEKSHSKHAKKGGHVAKYKVRGDNHTDEVNLEHLKGLAPVMILHLEDDDVA